jgi:hypothetical protein
MKSINYPVKYALLPVKTHRKTKNGEDFFITDCYIVSKAYVMEEHRAYRETGDYNANYKIFFPYVVVANSDGITSYNRGEPSDYFNKNYEDKAFYLYDSYEEALAAKEERNVLVSEEIIKKYKPIEEELLELTKNMIVENDEKAKTRRIIK